MMIIKKCVEGNFCVCVCVGQVAEQVTLPSFLGRSDLDGCRTRDHDSIMLADSRAH